MAAYIDAASDLLLRSGTLQATFGNLLPWQSALALASRAVTIFGPERPARLRRLLVRVGHLRGGGTYIGLSFRDVVAYWRARWGSR